AGMNADRVDVFHAADGDAAVGRVANDLKLDLFPARDAALQQHLLDGAVGQAPSYDVLKLLFGIGDAAAGAAQRKRGPHDDGKADVVQKAAGLVHAGNDAAFRHGLADFGHGALEQL